MGGADSIYTYEIISTWVNKITWQAMAAGRSSSGASTSAANGEEEPLHLLVVTVDASDVYTHSCSLGDPAKQVNSGGSL